MLDCSELPEVRLLFPQLKTRNEQLFVAHMLAREKALTTVFGDSDPPEAVTPPDPALAAAWTGGGVKRFKPNGTRKHWLYCTHGLAQPFPTELAQLKPASDADALSGFGLEYVLTTNEPADWPLQLLFSMARRVLLDEKAPLFLPGHRTSLKGSVLGGMVATLGDYETDLRLPGGGCTLVHLVGVTTEELETAKSLGGTARGTGVLLEVLEVLGVGVATDPKRASVTQHPDFSKHWENALKNIPET
jgi:hypothetical protein